MSGLLSLVRASLLGACLCIAAAQLPYAQSARDATTQQDPSEHASTLLAGHSELAPPEAPAQWIAYGSESSVPHAPTRRAPSDTPLGDLGGPGLETDADGGDDFDDAMSHAYLGLFCLDFGVAPQKRPAHRVREHLRREDRRCDKPPRPRCV